jgi:hypothetical protein
VGWTAAKFTWSEGVDESLNYWFWLRRVGALDDDELVTRLNNWAAGSSPFQRHLDISSHTRWEEYLPIGQAWKASEVARQMSDLQAQRPRHQRAHYRAVATIGISLRVEWVMAPFGDRWLIAPDLAVLGAEGSDSDARKTAVVAAAAALRAELVQGA